MNQFMENADWFQGGQADWLTGMGTLSVYLDDLYSPVLTVPMNFDALIHLRNGPKILKQLLITLYIHFKNTIRPLSSNLQYSYIAPAISSNIKLPGNI